MKNNLLLIPDKPDPERDALAAAWKNQGGEVKKIGKFWIKPEVGNKRVSLYGSDSFCLVLAQILDLEMHMPDDAFIAKLDYSFLKRKIDLIPVSDIQDISFPKFIKPAIPKLYKAEVFNSLEHLQEKIDGIETDKLLLVSDIISVDAEVRSFILDGKIMDLSFYEGQGNLEEAKAFIQDFLLQYKDKIPRAFVLDVGRSQETSPINQETSPISPGWFVIEFNSAWGAGLNGCNAEKVLPCVLEATKNGE